jgi:hypothetical protein
VRPRFSALWAAPASWSVDSPSVDLMLRSLFPFACALIRPSRNASASSRVPNSATIFRVRRLTTMNAFKAEDSGGGPIKLPTYDASQEGAAQRGIDANEGACRGSARSIWPPTSRVPDSQPVRNETQALLRSGRTDRSSPAHTSDRVSTVMPPRSTFGWEGQDHFERDSPGDASPTPPGAGVSADGLVLRTCLPAAVEARSRRRSRDPRSSSKDAGPVVPCILRARATRRHSRHFRPDTLGLVRGPTRALGVYRRRQAR